MTVAVLAVAIAVLSQLHQGFAQVNYAGYTGYYTSEGGYGYAPAEPSYTGGYGEGENGYLGYGSASYPGSYGGYPTAAYYYASYPPSPVAPSYPAAPSYPSYPSYPAAPSYPSYPSYPTAPSYPSYPSYPAAPSYPSYPSYPTAPSYPAAPSYPSYPSYPTAPSYPSYPSYPAAPSYPSYPSYPAAPSYPAYPSYPAAPSYPAYPSYPAAPSYPSYPSYPAAPSYPAYPSYPSYPSTPLAGGYASPPTYIYYTYPSAGGYTTYGYPAYSYPASPPQQCCACPDPSSPPPPAILNTTSDNKPLTPPVAKLASTVSVNPPKFTVTTSLSTHMDAGECFCSFDRDWQSWAIAEQPCREALYRRCDKHHRLPCSWLDAYYGAPSKTLKKPSEEDISRFLYNECPPAPPCLCSGELPDSTSTSTPSLLCCQQLSLHAAVPFSGLQRSVVEQVCMKYSPKLTPVVRQWVEKALWDTECPAGSSSEDAAVTFVKRVHDPLAPKGTEGDEIASMEAEAEARAVIAESTQDKGSKTMVGALTGAVIGMAAGLVVGGLVLLHMWRKQRAQQYGLML